MKCPKCGYLGFDSRDRCRNCGYDFSLAGEPGGPARGRATAKTSSATPDDLPLFRGDLPVLPPPRAPLAVRRATPAPARVRQRTPSRTPQAAPAPGAASGGFRADGYAGETPQRLEAAALAETGGLAAPASSRASAAAIDLGLISLIDVIVLHFTLALCGLTFADLRVLPALPMTAFLLLLDGAYFVLFTGTLGQTLGKMAMAIEVVPETRAKMDMRRSAVRAAALVASVLPAGIGWLAGLVGDRRGLHDRLAGTRVIRVAGV